MLRPIRSIAHIRSGSRRAGVACGLSLCLPAAAPHVAHAQRTTPVASRTDAIRLTVHEGTWLSLDRSRDGRRIAFDLLGQLWVVPAPGGEARRLTDAVRDTADDSDPAFAPDGASIAFAGERAGRPGLWRADVATGAVRRLTVAPQSDAQPAWSPDGRTIAFVREMGELRDGKPVLIVRYRQPIAAIVPISRLSPRERTLSKSRAAARRRR